MQTGVYAVLLTAALVAANLPWLSERFLLTIQLNKTAWWRWLEWLVWFDRIIGDGAGI